MSSLHSQQHLQVLLRNGEPAVAYTLQANETSYSVYRKFGMDDSLFLKLNQHDTLHAYDENVIYLAVKQILLAACNGDSCIELFYLANEKDNFKTIAAYFGNLNPFVIKELNPQLETITSGKPVMVGYLPAHMLDVKPPKITGKKNTKKVVEDTISVKTLYHGNGFYSNEFKHRDTATRTGKASNFKSFGGWYDGKYYILVKDYTPGNVVKVTNVQNGQFVFAKVVGPLPDMKSEKKLMARLNNAACAAIDIWDDSDFDIRIEE
jgi:hypothetical protein